LASATKERGMVTVTDNTDSAVGNVVAGPWLSPSEALTRFVPTQRAQRQGAREVAPIRFGFQVGDIGLLVPAGMLSELVDDTEVYPLPTTPAWFQGLINLRGALVPVFNLKKLFRIEDQGRHKPSVLVLNSGAEAVGVFIDGLPVTLDIGQTLPQSPPLPAILREHSQAVYLQGQDIWVEFDFDRFFRAAGGGIAA
jgi:twitching motility protein PilI